MSILLLLQELRTHIFQYCEKADLKNFSLCSKQCHQEVLPVLWHNLCVDWEMVSRQIPTEGHLRLVSYLELHSNLSPHRHAEFKDHVYDNFSTFLDRCASCRLRSVFFRRFLVHGGLQLVLQKFPLLQSLTLYNIRASRGNWHYIAAFVHLRELYISYCDVRDEDIANIKAIKCLQKLSVVGCQELTGKTLTGIGQLQGLCSFTFASSHQCIISSHEYVGMVQQIKGLKELEIYDIELLDDEFCKEALKHLSLRSLHISWTSVTDAGLCHIAGLKSLTGLNVAACSITNAGVECISSLSLQRLVISYNDVTDSGLHHIGKMISLLWLDIGHCYHITDEGIKYLVGLSSLENLHMANCNLTDSSVDSILKLPSLVKIEITGNQFSENGVCRLAKRVSVLL